MAPCLIPAVSSVYAGVVELNMTNPMSFVGSARSRIAAHLALAKVLGLPGEDVIITGISAGPVGSKTIQPAVGYEVITSAAEQLTASEIAAKAMPLQLALNSALQMNGVNSTISAIQMPDPAVAHSSQTTTTTTSTSTNEVLLIFKGSMLLTVSDKAKFLKSPSVELACQEAMIGAMQEAMVIEVSKDAVTMQGIRDAKASEEEEEAESGVVAVDFELNVKSSTETTADKIVALAPDVKAHLNSELDAKELSESVSKVEMKMPHVKRYYVVPGDDETSEEKEEKEKKKEDKNEEDEANEGKEEEKKKDEEEEKERNEKQEKDEKDAEKEEEKTKEEEKQKEEEEEEKEGEGEEQEHEDDQEKKKSKGKEGGGKGGKGEEK